MPYNNGLEKNVEGDKYSNERRIEMLVWPMTFIPDVELAPPGLGKQYRKEDGEVDVKLKTEAIKLALISCS